MAALRHALAAAALLAAGPALAASDGTLGATSTGTSNIALTGSDSQSCGGANNGSIKVSFSGTDLAPATAASDTGMLTLLVEPEV